VTLSALSIFRSVVITTDDGGITSFGTAEATTIIDPLLATPVVVFPVADAGFALLVDSGDTGMNVAFSGVIHVSGAELFFDPLSFETALKSRNGGFLTHPTIAGL